MLQDAWLDAHAKLLEFNYLHGNLVWAAVVVGVVGFFVYRWRAAR
jgi:hypothetical protein